MKNPFSKSNLAVALASVVVCGATYAAVAPLTMPWQDMTPKTQEHEHVLAGVGEFEGTLTMFIPGMPEPMKVPCSEVVTAVGELWTTSRFETTFMGMPFTGASTYGFDPNKKKYVGTWIDSTSTSLTTMEGVYNEELKAVVMEYEAFDPPSGKSKKMRSEMALTEDGYSMTFFDMDSGDAVKQMHMAVRRKGKAMEAGDK